MRDGGRVDVHGIRELQQALRRIDADFPKQLRVELNEVARTVVSATRAKVPRRTGAARESIRPRSTQRAAAIAFGGRAAPYYPWLDFGGSVGRRRSVRRPFVKEGRYLYPTIREMRPEIVKQTDEALKAMAKRAGFDTGGRL